MIGRVYKIVHSQSDICYVGSTMNELRVRWNQHKTATTNRCSITSYIQSLGAENFKIILIKEYEVVDQKHLKTKEQLWISKLKCINTNNTFRVDWIGRKDYYIKTRDYILKYQEEYRAKNGEALKAKHVQYNIEREEKRKAKSYCEVCKYDIVEREHKRHERSIRHQSNLIQYREPKHEKKTQCDVCNIEVGRMNRHNKSKKHIDNLAKV